MEKGCKNLTGRIASPESVSIHYNPSACMVKQLLMKSLHIRLINKMETHLHIPHPDILSIKI